MVDPLVAAVGAAPTADGLGGGAPGAAAAAAGLPSSPAVDDARALYAEFYGACRTQLAALSPAELAAVASGWRCEFWDVLAPVRAARVDGPDEAVITGLRTLNFVLG
jgi:hypothetical protein